MAVTVRLLLGLNTTVERFSTGNDAALTGTALNQILPGKAFQRR